MKMKKMLSAILAIVMVLSLMGTAVFAAEDAVAMIGEGDYPTLQAALDAAWNMQGDVTITLLPGTIAGNYFINQVEGLNLTIRAEERGTVILTGGFTIDGLGKAAGTNTVLIENLKFDASAVDKAVSHYFIYGADREDVSNPYKPEAGYKYPHNVTIKNCDFIGNGADGNVVPVQNSSGNTCYNYTITGCSATNVHSFLQANGTFEGLSVSGNTITGAGRGLNLVQSTDVTLSGNEISVEKYGLRIGASSGGSVVTTYDINNNKITTSSNDDDDAAIVLRKTTTGATVSLEKNAVVVTGTAVDITFDGVSSDAVTVDAGLNYWGGASPQVSGGTVSVSGYYTDEDMTESKEAADLEIYTVADLKAFASKVNSGTSYAGKTVELMNDIDMAGVTDWEPIGQSGKRFQGTFDGQDHTISNFRSVKDMGYGNGFFCDITGGAVIKNVTFDNAYVARYDFGDEDVYSGNVYGIVSGYAYGNVTFENVTVRNSKVLGFGKVGAILGMAADPGGTTVVRNCLVENTTIAGTYDCGGVVGLVQNNIELTGTRTTGVVWAGDPDEEYKECKAVAEDGTVIDGIYWVYGTYHYGAWGSMYVDYDEATADGVTYELVYNAQAKISSASTMSLRSATIGDVYYATLQDAINAVQDDETVTLLKDITVADVANAINVTRGVNFTLDLGGHTLTANTTNAAIRMNINNDAVTAPVEITITNGTITAGSSAYCALITAGKDSTNTLTVNLENVSLNGSKSDGSVVKGFEHSIINVKAGTVITGADSYGALEVMGTANIYDGAELYQNGTTSYNGMLIGACGDGVANVYGGKGVSANAGLIVMTSGGTINVYGGEWTANNGEPGTGNKAVLISQNDKNSYPNGGDSVLNVFGGTFTGGFDCAGYTASSSAKLSISGGIFSEDPSRYLAEGFEMVETENGYAIAEEKASAVKVVFAETDDEDVYDIKLVSTDEYEIYKFVGAELTFKNDSKTVANEDMRYEILGLAGVTDADKSFEKADTYALRLIDNAEPITGKDFVIGQVKFIGQGTINFAVTEGKVVATQFGKTLERYYIADADELTEDTLLLADSKITDGTVEEATGTVTVKVAYNHLLDGTYWEDNQITVTLKDAFGATTEAMDISDGEEIFENVKLGKVIITLEAPGFRKYVYQTKLESRTEPLVLQFWNEVKTGTAQAPKLEIEVGKGLEEKNFLVGDIVMDYIIDEYDLAAVTSYYGTYNLTDAEKHMKYDLNRDGNIDIMDVAYVLHGYNE